MRVNLLDISRDGGAATSYHRAQLQVLFDCHADESTPALRHMGDPEAHDIFSGAAEKGLAVEASLTAEAKHSTERAQCRRLAGAIGAKQRYDIALVEREVEAVKSLVLTVKRTQPVH